MPFIGSGALLQLGSSHCDGIVDHLPQIALLERWVGPFPRQLVHPQDARCGVGDHAGKRLEMGIPGRVGHFATEELQPHAHDVQRIVQIVRQPGGKLSNGLHAVASMEGLLRHAQLGLGPELFGDVVRENDDHAVPASHFLGAQLDDLIDACTPASDDTPPGRGARQKPFCLVERKLAQAPLGARGGAGFQPLPAESISRPVELVPPCVAERDRAVSHQGHPARRRPQRPPAKAADREVPQRLRKRFCAIPRIGVQCLGAGGRSSSATVFPHRNLETIALQYRPGPQYRRIAESTAAKKTTDAASRSARGGLRT